MFLRELFNNNVAIVLKLENYIISLLQMIIRIWKTLKDYPYNSNEHLDDILTVTSFGIFDQNFQALVTK